MYPVTKSNLDVMENTTHCKLKLKKLGRFWLLDIGGKLKRLNPLNDAQDVHMEENVTFADGSMYQVDIRSDEIVTITKVEELYDHDDCEQIDLRREEMVIQSKAEKLYDCKTDGSSYVQAIQKDVALSEGPTGIIIHMPIGLCGQDHGASISQIKYIESIDGSVLSDFHESLSDKHHESGTEECTLTDTMVSVNDNSESTLGSVVDTHHTDSDEGLEMGHDYMPQEDNSDTDHLLEMGQEEYVPKEGVFEFVTVKALFDFDAVFENELSFKQGDKLDIDKDLFGQASFWWYASHQDCRKKGYIPSSFVLKDENSLEAQDWWFNGNETDAETLLRHSSFQSGTFLVRQAIGEDSYMLSVKDIDKETDTPFISHYKIRHWKDRGYYICENRCFDNIPKLISQYSCETNGICCKLEKPCPKDPPELPIRLYEWLKWLEVTRSSVKIGDKVPVSSFGDKCYGTFLNDRIAIKTLRDKAKPVDDLLGEAYLLKDLRHKRLVQLLALCTDKMPFWMITEDVTNGDLLACLREDMGRSLQLNVLVHIASQISDAMDYLTKQKVVHRNLRACNILIGAGNKVKVSGLELAKRMYDDNCIYASDGQIPVKWTPPEAVIYNKFSAKSDVWSYGILLYEIISFGMSPYSGMSNSVALRRVCEGYRMPKPETGSIDCPDPYYEMMLKCWEKK